MTIVAKSNLSYKGRVFKPGESLPEGHDLTEAEVNKLVADGDAEVKAAPKQEEPAKQEAPATKATPSGTTATKAAPAKKDS